MSLSRIFTSQICLLTLFAKLNSRKISEFTVLTVYAQKPPLNVQADLSSLVRGLNCGLCLHRHP